MTLPVGTRLGPYEILAPIGAGGMGEVLRARDTRLDRDVAIKILPEGLFENAERKQRLEREAKLLAAVSHPNIAAIYSFEEISGRCLLVQEFLAGEPLRLVLAKGPLSARHALDVAEQMAEALAAAHENGIVHRDVKPENVFLGPDGRVKLLDFGLARHDGSRDDAGNTRSPTVTDLSRPGSVAGTVAYMSPEQARGETVDYRSDQFSLGVVLYEMLTGKRPFVRDSAAQTMAAIIQDEPEPLSKGAPSAPAPVRWIVERCLAKEPEGRFESTRDLAKDLATCETHYSETSSAGTVAAAALPPRRVLARWAPWALAAVAVAVALAVTIGRKPVASNERFDIELPAGHQLRPSGQALDISPDGRQIVFAAFRWRRPYAEVDPTQLFIRPLDSFEAKPLEGSESRVDPVFSPDGRWIAFWVPPPDKPRLRKLPAEGGAPITLCECVTGGGLAWVGGDALVFGSYLGGPLQRVPATGGKPEPVTQLDDKDGEVSHRLPHILPDGRTLIYTAVRYAGYGATWDRARIYAQRLGSETRSLLVEGGSDGRWAPPGVLLFARNGTLFAAPFSSSSLSLTGPALPILEGVQHSIGGGTRIGDSGAVQVAVSADGRLVYAPGSVEPERPRALVWVDQTGRETPIDLPKQSYLSLNLSPDGKQLLTTHNYPGQQVEILDLERGARRRVTFAGSHPWAIWGPGPGNVTFVSDHEGAWALYSHALDAPPEQVETLWRGPGRGVHLGSWSPDGKILVFATTSDAGDADVWLLERGGEARPFLSTRFEERCPEISPDGRWLLYVSDEPGESEVLVRSLDSKGPARQVSVGGGGEPVWGRDGKTIFFKKHPPAIAIGPWTPRPVAVYRVHVKESAAALEIGRPEKLFEGPYGAVNTGRDWDVSPDGRFLLDKPASREENEAYLDQIYRHRIRVDLGGVPRLMAQAEKKP